MNERKEGDSMSKNAPAAGQPVPGGQTGNRDFAAPLGSAKIGRLRFVRGASNVTIQADPAMGELYRARFDGSLPEVWEESGVVIIRYPRFFLHPFGWRAYSGAVALNPQVPWHVEVRVGASRLVADLSGLELASLDLSGGASRVEVTLPHPSGTVTVGVLGGVSNVTIRRPAGVAARLSVGSGASNLIFDDQRFGAVGAKVELHSPDYDGAADRYDVTITGGANNLTLDAW
jgi:hypothetical protein